MADGIMSGEFESPHMTPRGFSQSLKTAVQDSQLYEGTISVEICPDWDFQSRFP